MDNAIQLIVKVQQFEDKRIEAKASWNIKELKGKLSEIYPTVSLDFNYFISAESSDRKRIVKAFLRSSRSSSSHKFRLR